MLRLILLQCLPLMPLNEILNTAYNHFYNCFNKASCVFRCESFFSPPEFPCKTVKLKKQSSKQAAELMAWQALCVRKMDGWLDKQWLHTLHVLNHVKLKFPLDLTGHKHPCSKYVHPNGIQQFNGLLQSGLKSRNQTYILSHFTWKYNQNQNTGVKEEFIRQHCICWN